MIEPILQDKAKKILEEHYDLPDGRLVADVPDFRVLIEDLDGITFYKYISGFNNAEKGIIGVKELEGSIYEICKVVVYRECRGLRVGKMMQEELLCSLKEHKIKKVVLDVLVTNINYIILNLKMGFEIEGRVISNHPVIPNWYILGLNLSEWKPAGRFEK